MIKLFKKPNTIFRKNGKTYVEVSCSCGTQKVVRLDVFKNSKSCGKCLPRKMIHNSCKTRMYRIFNGLTQRCNNPNNKDYKNYGGRGIKCEWSSFKDFKSDMLNGYSEQLSIDRIDNNGNYSKNNCRWATKKIQQNNTRKNKKIIFNGMNKSISEWSKCLNIKRYVIENRLNRGWEVDRALTTSIRVYGN